MTPYFLLRDNRQSGPYSLDQLKAMGLRGTDLIWVEGGSALWRYPHEVPIVSEIWSKASENTGELQLEMEPAEQSSGTTMSENGINVEVRHWLMEENTNNYDQKTPDNGDGNPAENIGGDHPLADRKPGEPTGPIKAIIADDHAMFREGVKMALSDKADISMIGEAENGVHLLNLLKHQRPDVILLDIEMPVMDGITALKEIRKTYGNLKVIILSMHDTRSMVVTLMKTGANSYLSKSADAATIYNAILGVHKNDFHYTDLSGKSLIEGLNKLPEARPRSHKHVRDKSDMMLKLRAINKHHSPRIPSRRKRKKSMILLGLAIITALVVFGIFYRIDQSPKNKIMYAGPLRDSISPPERDVQPMVVAPETTGTSIHELLAEQDSMLQNRKPVILRSAELPKPAVKEPKNPRSRHTTTKPLTSSRPAESPSTAAVATEPVVETEKVVESPVVRDKSLAKYQLRNQLSVIANDYSKGVFGGVSNIELTISNKNNQPVDDVVIQLEYLLPGKKVFKTEVLHSRNIDAQSSVVIKAPKSSRGVSIQYWITNFSAPDVE